jgi:hypothetical protein
LASVFDTIDPIKNLKTNIRDMNESLAEIEQQSFRDIPTPTTVNQDVQRHETPIFIERKQSPVQRKRWDDKIASD